MCKTKVIAGMLIMIALAGLPAGVQAQGGDDGVVAEWHFDEGSGGVLEKIKAGPGYYFTTPVEARSRTGARLPGSRMRPGRLWQWCLR